MATSTVKPIGSSRPGDSAIPPLENGDHLTRAEFERRYDAMPDLKKAELIEGVVYMASPGPHERHGEPHFDLIGWLGHYATATPGVEGGDNSSLRLDLDNMPQPDAFLYDPAPHRRPGRISEDDYIEGGPELIAEVASSSVSYDLHDEAPTSIAAMGCANTSSGGSGTGRSTGSSCARGSTSGCRSARTGIYRSEVFPGLWLDPAALIRGDSRRVVEVVGAGPGHARARGVRRAAAGAAAASGRRIPSPDLEPRQGGAAVPAVRTLALVVRTVEVFETSLVVTLFTRELGKVVGAGQGGAAAEVAVPGWP